MIVVKYIRPYCPYAIGDIRGVEKPEANTLIDAGICEVYKTKAIKEPPKNKMMANAPRAKAFSKKVRTKK